MSVRIIEAKYQVTTVQFWEIKHIEDWPVKESGELRELYEAHDYFIKWGRLCVKWDKDGDYEEYEATSEENGEGDEMKWPDFEYHDGKEIE
tara:strand:+ start:1301 stop:1573 length:273 start_codon:yes stop_codon:yes gene_type:complete